MLDCQTVYPRARSARAITDIQGSGNARLYTVYKPISQLSCRMRTMAARIGVRKLFFGQQITIANRCVHTVANQDLVRYRESLNRFIPLSYRVSLAKSHLSLSLSLSLYIYIY